MHQIREFEWSRDGKGYQLLSAERPKPRWSSDGGTTVSLSQNLSIVERDGPRRIARRGGPLIRYRLTDVDAFRQFAKVTTPEEVLDFVEKFGSLTLKGRDEGGDSVAFALQNAGQMKRVLAADPWIQRIDVAEIQAAVIRDPTTKRPGFQLFAKELLAALWVQLGQSLSRRAVTKECLECRALFEVGPGTGRRFDAKFCSDEHRIAFNSRRRSLPHKGRKEA